MRFGDGIKLQLKTAARWGLATQDVEDSQACSRILTYHSVGSRDHEMNVTVEEFGRQMEWLAHHAEVVDLNAAAFGERGVAITFDDGYRDTLTNAARIMAEYGLTGTVFVVAGRAGMRLAHDIGRDSAELMTWDEIREIESMGWTIGGHSLTHQRLAALSPHDQRAEIRGCTHQLEDSLGHAIESFAYPYGSSLDYDECSKRIVRECGYRLAVSNRYGPNFPGCDCWALRRLNIDRMDTLRSFAAKVQGSLDRLAWLDSALGIRARRAVNGLLKTA